MANRQGLTNCCQPPIVAMPFQYVQPSPPHHRVLEGVHAPADGNIVLGVSDDGELCDEDNFLFGAEDNFDDFHFSQHQQLHFPPSNAATTLGQFIQEEFESITPLPLSSQPPLSQPFSPSIHTQHSGAVYTSPQPSPIFPTQPPQNRGNIPCAPVFTCSPTSPDQQFPTAPPPLPQTRFVPSPSPQNLIPQQFPTPQHYMSPQQFPSQFSSQQFSPNLQPRAVQQTFPTPSTTSMSPSMTPSPSVPALSPTSSVLTEEPTVQTLRDLHNHCAAQETMLNWITQEHHQLVDGSQQNKEFLKETENNLKLELEHNLQSLKQLYTTSLLSALDLSFVESLTSELSYMLEKISLLYREIIEPQSIGQRVSLIIKKQPFPVVVRKNEQLSVDDQIVVQLLSSPLGVPIRVSSVQVQIISDNPSLSRSPSVHALLDPESATVDSSHNATFRFKFTDGTKNTPIALKFTTQVLIQGSGNTILAETPPTNPFVVITHKEQWKGSQGVLLKHEAFGGMLAITWPQFANSLQQYFLRLTKQKWPHKPLRPLSLLDMSYFHKTFFDALDTVQQSQFDRFWMWLSSTLYTLNFQKPMLGLWESGLVYGFVQKKEVEAYLAQMQPGTFIIRFSESQPGYVTIGYRTTDSVRHYLVSDEDLAVHKYLPDFICARDPFVELLKLDRNQSGEHVLRKVDKLTAFDQFWSKRSSTASIPKGYSYLSKGL
ncbi:transcriptional repressor [Pelomyxa schiedti]|nr:transcriptional repressor [Pelomyxa schiedti]